MKKRLLPFIVLLSLVFCIAMVNAQENAKKMPHPTMAMDNSAVDAILTAMKNQLGDDGKLSVLERVVKNNIDGIMVAQQLRLMNQFSTDDAKLECAKFLYPWSVDYKNYDKIKYNLATPVAQKALADYIKKKGK
ncbi:MAG: DUF4476 domain-containing protein [Bacteroidota bacterium]